MLHPRQYTPHATARPDFAAYESFLQVCQRDLRKIAYRTSGEQSLEDVQQAAWIVAHEIGHRRGHPVRFNEPQDQELVIGWLHNELVAFADKSTRYAMRIDAPALGADGEEMALHPVLARLLSEPSASSPLALLEADEEAAAGLNSLRRSYSEATAYVWLLRRFKWSVEALAADLGLVVTTLRQRFVRAVEVFRKQPSLFDGRDEVDPEFQPTRRADLRSAPTVTWNGHQACWLF